MAFEGRTRTKEDFDLRRDHLEAELDRLDQFFNTRPEVLFQRSSDAPATVGNPNVKQSVDATNFKESSTVNVLPVYESPLPLGNLRSFYTRTWSLPPSVPEPKHEKDKYFDFARHFVHTYWGEPCTSSRYSRVMEKFRREMDSVRVQTILILLVIVDAVIVAVHLANDSKDNLEALQLVIIVLLGIDVCCRLAVEKIKFFKNFINMFELFVILYGVIVDFILIKDPNSVGSALRVSGRIVRLVRPFILMGHHHRAILKTAQKTAHHKVFKLLVRILHDIVRIDPKAVFLDPAEGSFHLLCAEIEAETFSKLFLPITITGGFVENCRISIPLHTAVEIPGQDQALITVRIRNVLLLLGPVLNDWEYDDVVSCVAAMVDLLAQRIEMLTPIFAKDGKNETKEENPVDEEAPPADTLPKKGGKVNRFKLIKKRVFRRIVNRWLHHISFDIRDLCIRYEDNSPKQKLPIACGLSIGSLRYRAVILKDGVETKVQSQQSEHRAAQFKIKTASESLREQDLSFQQITAFWDIAPKTSFSDKFRESPRKLWKEFISSRRWEALKLGILPIVAQRCAERSSRASLMEGPMFRERLDHHYYIIFPWGGQLVVINKSNTISYEPPTRIEMKVQPINIAIDNRQLDSFNKVMDHISDWKMVREVMITRPSQGVLAKKGLAAHEHHLHIRLWWQHAVRSLQVQLKLWPRTFSVGFKDNYLKSVGGEYKDLMIEYERALVDNPTHRFRRRNDNVRRTTMDAKKQWRLLALQVSLSISTTMRMRILAKREAEELVLQKVMSQNHQPASWSQMLKLTRTMKPSPDDRDQIMFLPSEHHNDLMDIQVAHSASFAFRSQTIQEEVHEDNSGLDLFMQMQAEVEAECEKGDQLCWSYTTEVQVRLDSLQIFILRHNMWTEMATNAKAMLRDNSNDLSSHTLEAPRSNKVGGFGFERFGGCVCPRIPLVSLGFIDFDLKIELPPNCFGVSAAGATLDMYVAEVYAKSYSLKDELNQILNIEQLLDGGMKKVVVLHVEQEDVSKLGAAKPAKQPSFQSMEKAHGSLFKTLNAARWVGVLEVGKVNITYIRPLVERVRLMFTTGRRRVSKAADALAPGRARRRPKKTNPARRIITWCRPGSSGKIFIKCKLHQVKITMMRRYSKSSVCVATTTIPRFAAVVSSMGMPPSLAIVEVNSRSKVATPTASRKMDDAVAREELSWIWGPIDEEKEVEGFQELDEGAMRVIEMMESHRGIHPHLDTIMWQCAESGLEDVIEKTVEYEMPPQPQDGSRTSQGSDSSLTCDWLAGLPVEVDITFKKPEEVGLTTGNAALWAEDYLFLAADRRKEFAKFTLRGTKLLGSSMQLGRHYASGRSGASQRSVAQRLVHTITSLPSLSSSSSRSMTREDFGSHSRSISPGSRRTRHRDITTV